MPDQEVIEVYRAKNGMQAKLFADALEDAGVRAQVQGDLFNPEAQTAAHPLFEAAPYWDAPRILVFASDETKARQLLAELEARDRSSGSTAEVTGPDIAAVCEDCGHTAAYPAAQRGTVQDCPHCGAFVDVGEMAVEDEDFRDDEAEPTDE